MTTHKDEMCNRQPHLDRYRRRMEVFLLRMAADVECPPTHRLPVIHRCCPALCRSRGTIDLHPKPVDKLYDLFQSAVNLFLSHACFDNQGIAFHDIKGGGLLANAAEGF